MSFFSRTVPGALLALAPGILAAQAVDENNAWKGRLYCLAAWARDANPDRPKSIAEAFLGGASLLPRPVPGLAGLTFAVDTDSAEARRWFGQGLGCLHLLWNEEAERSFRAVVAIDPECAMGFWGLAMANIDRPGRAGYFARMAAGKLRPSTSREVRAWVELLGRFHADPGADLQPRLLRLASDLEDRAMAAPEDVEAKALYLRQLVLNAYRGGIPLRSPWSVDRLAAEIAARAPSHPALVHRLFLWMNHKPGYLVENSLLDPARLPADAVGPRWRFLAEAQLAAGLDDEAAVSLVRALEAGVGQRAAWFAQPILVPGFDENVQVLAETLSRLGRVEPSLALARAMVAQPVPAAAGGREAPERFEQTSYARGIRLYAQTCIEHGLRERLRRFEADLPLHRNPSPAERGLRDEIAALAGGGPAAAVDWISTEARLAEAVAAARPVEAARIVGGMPQTRRRAFLPRALEILHHLQAGRTKEAMFGFDNQFRAAAGSSDSPLRGAQGFRELAGLRRVEGEWVLPAAASAARLDGLVTAAQAAYRTDFPSAPAFALPDGKRSPVALADFRGEPVLVIFFLGAGCLQCAEQLHAFLPLGPEFERSGIGIVAVSSDPVEVLEFTIREEKRGQQPIPFTIVSDARLEAFRQYLVYNEFEKRPMHGTFLLDGDGKVRWRTTGNEPFMDPRWLLAESRRILAGGE